MDSFDARDLAKSEGGCRVVGEGQYFEAFEEV